MTSIDYSHILTKAVEELSDSRSYEGLYQQHKEGDPLPSSQSLQKIVELKQQYPDALEKLSPYIVTCHLHDNDGYSDGHQLPGRGTANWDKIVAGIKKCPNLRSIQSEVVITPDLSIGELTAKFNSLFGEK